MQRQLRKGSADRIKDAQVLYDDAVESFLNKRTQELAYLAEFLFLDQRIQGQIDLYPMAVCLLQYRDQLFRIKISAVCTRTELIAGQIDCIRPGVNSRQKALIAAAGCKQLRFSVLLSDHFLLHKISFSIKYPIVAGKKKPVHVR